MTEFWHLLFVCIVLAFLVWIAGKVAPNIPAPFGWVPWVVVAIIAVVVLAQILGVRLPA